MPHRTRRRLLLAMLAAGVLGLPACRQAGDVAVGTASERLNGEDAAHAGDADRDRQLPDEAATQVAGAEGASVPLPADFPQDVHLPAPLRVESAMDMAGLQMVNVTTTSAIGQVSADVEQGMQARGWKREMARQAGNGSTLVYSKDQRQTVYQLIRRARGGTQLAIRTGAGG